MPREVVLLSIEDAPEQIALTKLAFKHCQTPHRLEFVQNGADAMPYLLKQGKYTNVVTPDLILLDLNLPERDGREILQEIKSHPVLRKIPVFVLSTSSHQSEVDRCYELHANCYYRKPLTFENFIELAKSIEFSWMKTAELPSHADSHIAVEA